MKPARSGEPFRRVKGNSAGRKPHLVCAGCGAVHSFRPVRTKPPCCAVNARALVLVRAYIERRRAAQPPAGPPHA